MHKVTENIAKMYNHMGKPLVELAELNAKSMNKIAEQTKMLYESAQNRRPEDFFSANMAVFSTVSAAITDYNRKLAEIVVSSLTDTGKALSEAMQDTSSWASCGFPGKSDGAEHSSGSRHK